MEATDVGWANVCVVECLIKSSDDLTLREVAGAVHVLNNRDEIAEEGRREVTRELLGDTVDHRACLSSRAGDDAILSGSGISVLKQLVGARLQLLHERNCIAGQGASDRLESVIELLGEVRSDRVYVGVCTGLQCGSRQVLDARDDGSGEVANELLDDTVHCCLECIERTAVAHVALQVGGVCVLLDGKRVARLHHLDL